jgi:hypothetical protein
MWSSSWLRGCVMLAKQIVAMVMLTIMAPVLGVGLFLLSQAF